MEVKSKKKRSYNKCKYCKKTTQSRVTEAKDICKTCIFEMRATSLELELDSLTPFQFGWLIGFIEGEGCFIKKTWKYKDTTYSTLYFDVTNTDLDSIQRASEYLNFEVKGPYKRKNKKDFYKDAYSIRISGIEAEVLATKLYPYLSKRRQETIDSILEQVNENNEQEK